MSTKKNIVEKLIKKKALLSYISPEEKHGLVGSFVIDDYWETFNEEESDAIKKFRAIAKASIQSFIEAYKDVWDFVVDINQLDDTFLSESNEKNKIFEGLSYKELRIANQLLSLSLYSELEKDCLMALNKTILGELASDLSKKYGFSDEEFQLLMTPSFETFFTKYHFDHLEYVINDEPKSKEYQRKSLIEKFHAKDGILLELRLADMYFPEDDDLENTLSAHKKALAERSAKKNAFISEREELIAFEKLLEYDNLLDFEYRYNLQACPEYYLRKLLFSTCQENGIFTEYSNPLALKDADFIDGVSTLIDARARKYIIKLDSCFDINDNTSFAGIEKVQIGGSKEKILEYLKEGFPCLALKEGLSSEHASGIIIVGYDNSTILAQNGSGERFELSEPGLEEFKKFYVLKKYSKHQVKELEKSIKKLIERKPYLDRTEYERGF